MEPGDDQYCDCGHRNIYIYAGSRPMCNDGYFKYYDQSAAYSGIHSNGAAVPECYCSCFANNVQQWRHRNLEPGNCQYCNCRNTFIHFHTGRWPVCNYVDDKYYS